ncbi:MAG: tetratricopeptide repeat protein, partial [Luteibaculum sp.]
SNQAEPYFDLAILHKRLKDDKKAEKFLEKGMEQINANRGIISSIGRKLENAALYQEAQFLYEYAGKLNLGYGFNLELANLYGVQGQTSKMVQAYINLVRENPAYMNSVQSALIRYLDFTDDQEQAELLRTELLLAVQEHPDNTHLAELLIWYYYQMAEFAPAFAQLRALDLRFNEQGERIFEFAQLAARNREYNVAYRAYDYLLEQYSNSSIKSQVITQRAKMAYLELEQIPYPSSEEINKVMGAFDQAIGDLGKNAGTASLLIDYADYTLKYGAGAEAAIALLQDVLDIPNLYDRVRGLAKLRLADIYVIQGKIWEATLLYGQVDMAFKEDELGAEAKYRKAKIAFYTGDFEWAQAQLDILKSATSELISNNAMELSLLISNNFNLDTVREPLELYAAADLAVVQNKVDEALLLLDSLELQYPSHSLGDEILMVRYQVAMKRKEFDLAAKHLNKILEFHAFDLLGDNALFLLANLYLNELGDREKAAELFEKLLIDYPGSLFIIESRKQFRRLRGDIYFEG